MRMMKFIGSAALAMLAISPIVANASGAALLSVAEPTDGGAPAATHAHGTSTALIILGLGAVIAGAVALGTHHHTGTPASA